MKYTEIKNFEDACKALNIAPALPEVSMLPFKHQKAIIAHYQLIIIAAALNEGWEPDWNDSYQYKYFPWFDVDADDKRPSGFGLSFDGYDVWFTVTGVGSRLCFKSSEIATYAGKQFKKYYEDSFLIS